MSAPAALFDFDGTLVRRDSTMPVVRALLSLRPWLATLAAPWAIRVRLARSAQALQAAKAALLGVLLRGLTEERAAPALDQAAVRMRRARRAAVVEAVRAGAARGVRVLVVSASPAVFLRRAVADLPVEVVATEFELEGDRFTGRVRGEICFGDAKVRAVRERLGADAVVEDAWSDSLHDRPMMELARTRHWLCPPADADEVRRIDPAAVVVAPSGGAA